MLTGPRRHLTSGLARLYLGHFPIEKGKWRVWSRLHAGLREAGFQPGLYELKHGSGRFTLGLRPCI
jgi:hypothetical protein